jgi:CRISPR/Cas system-associated exonuclease Cas4 (RecB family)
MFDPRKRNILYPEQRFDITIDKPWAHFKYKTKDGPLEGQLSIKGTIDLITQPNENTAEIIDWKTGRRLNWATGEEKTQEKLEVDPQLMIYYYAVKKLYPHIDNVIVTIYFINDGGPFSVAFDKSDMHKTEQLLKDKFKKIQHTLKPRLSKSWKCTKLCHYGKTTFEGTNIEPITEYRDGMVCNVGDKMTKCQQVAHDIGLKGYQETVDEYTTPGYNVGHYKAPGSTE